MTWIILWVTDHTVGLRVSPGEETEGLDLGEHGEVAYQLAEPEAAMTGDGLATAPGSPHATEAP
jgi:Amt family ammonium transporter